MSQELSNIISDYITKRVLKKTPEENIRQAFEKMLVEDYGYPKDRMDIEFNIQRGSKKNNERADIVIFNDSVNKNQMNVFLIVETEPPDHEFDYQVISYVTATPALFCIWTNGKDTKFFYRSPSNPTKFEDIPQIPLYGETIGDIGRHRKTQLKPATTLKLIFEIIHNSLYGMANIRRPEILGQEMTKILFCKIHDEKNLNPVSDFRATVDEINNPLGNKKVVERIKHLFNGVKNDYNDVFEKNEEIKLDDYSVAFVVSKLQNISLLKSDADIIGEAFEVFVPEEFKGAKGEFFTPRPVVRMAVEIINIDPLKKERILDPACGSGGFLIVAMEKIRDIFDIKYKNSHLSSTELEKVKGDYIRRNFFGIEIESDLARISKAYMAIMGDGRSGIFQADSLDNPSNWSTIMQEQIRENSFDIILTNPPFGAKIPITKKSIIEQYDMGRTYKELDRDLQTSTNLRNSQVPDILFMEKCIRLLRLPVNDNSGGGRIAIVLPRGILNNPDKITDRAARKWLLDNTKILAIIDLPDETFQPYTNTKTSVVFAERSVRKFNQNYSVFMAISNKIGHDKRGNSVYKRDNDGKPIENAEGSMMLDIDTDDIVKDYRAYIEGKNTFSNKSFVVSLQEILEADRIDASYFNPAARMARKKIISSVPRGWKLATVGDVTKDVFYPPRFKRIYVEKQYGIPFLSGSNITRHTKVGIKYLSKKTKKLDEYIVKNGWILVTRSGTSGILVYADKSFEEIAVSEHVIRIVPDESKIDSGYLFAILNSHIYKPILESAITGSMVDEITPDFIKRLEIPLPDNRHIQKDIGKKVVESQIKLFESMTLLTETEEELTKLLNL